MTASKKIVAVNFTFAMPGGMHVRYEDGSQEWLTFSQIEKAYGPGHCSVLYKRAYANGMTGMWYNAANGRNCYVDGVLVNA